MLLSLLAAAALATPEAAAARAESSLFICTPVIVQSARGPITCAEGPRIVVWGVAAADPGGVCRPRRPCPAYAAPALRSALATALQPDALRQGADGAFQMTGAATLHCSSQGRERGVLVARCLWSPKSPPLTLGFELACTLIEFAAAAEMVAVTDHEYAACRGRRGGPPLNN